MRAAAEGAELEHIGIGVSMWQQAPDGIRYREARGAATLFVPAGAFKFSVNPRSSGPVTLEIAIEGRVVNVVTLAPQRWNDISVPPRTVTSSSRYLPMDLRTTSDPPAVLWLSKVEPLGVR
jgi:hypothetical protein